MTQNRIHPSRRSGLFVLVCALGSGCAYMDVPAGHVGVDWTLAGTSDKVYREGEWSIGFYDKATVYDARSQDKEEQLNVLAVNGLRITLDTSIRYHIVPDDVIKLDRELGSEYYAVLIGPTLRSQARRVIGRYQPDEIYSTKREAIEREIREGIETAIKGRHIELEAVLIRGVTLPEEIQHAINDKLEAEQQTLKQRYLLDTAKQVADRQKLEAQAEADRERIQAQAQADAKRIAAQATSDYEKLIRENLTPQILQWQHIQALDELSRSNNSKVIFLGEGKATPLLEVK